ncbi:hypothetical protein [Thauera sinica]|uniref:HK97 gp10 family phage protein n=1 Tax=Thauera sinica TaxID=2665146 RepID=A0ABW1ARJ3_9RHOO|nr:hypothetical protein [Thauera sp. K11]
MDVRFDASDVAALQRAFIAAPDLTAEELHAFMARATAHLQAEVQERTPTTHGTLRASIFGEVDPFGKGLHVTGITGTPSAYVLPVEFGSKPHYVGEKGIEALTDWAEQKLGVTGEEAVAAAHRVAWKIRHHGTKPVRMFGDAFNANRPQIGADFARTVRDLLKRIERAAQ